MADTFTIPVPSSNITARNWEPLKSMASWPIAPSRHYLSNLGVVEAHSVFARLARMGQITTTEFQRLRGRLLADIATGLWQVIQVTATDFQQAQQLLGALCNVQEPAHAGCSPTCGRVWPSCHHSARRFRLCRRQPLHHRYRRGTDRDKPGDTLSTPWPAFAAAITINQGHPAGVVADSSSTIFCCKHSASRDNALTVSERPFVDAIDR